MILMDNYDTIEGTCSKIFAVPVTLSLPIPISNQSLTELNGITNSQDHVKAINMCASLENVNLGPEPISFSQRHQSSTRGHFLPRRLG